MHEIVLFFDGGSTNLSDLPPQCAEGLKAISKNGGTFAVLLSPILAMDGSCPSNATISGKRRNHDERTTEGR
jgi:hypothetical protein